MPQGAGLIAGRYRLDRVLGAGGMGKVWHAHDEFLKRDVAVKELLLPPQVADADRSDFCARTVREARSAARLSHPGIVTIHDVIEQGGLPWIVMELVPGRALDDLIKAAGPLAPKRAARIGLQVLAALRTAHAADVTHRDVKPSNILLGPRHAVLTDFGIATIEGDNTITRSGVVIGTPAFMAPEQARGSRATAKSDLWSLGATLYAAVEGGPPFTGPSAGAIFMALASEDPAPTRNAGPLKPVIEGLLRKDPRERLRAADAARLLRQVMDGATAESLPPAGTKRAGQSTLPRTRAAPMAQPPNPAPGAARTTATDLLRLGLGVAVVFVFLLPLAIAGAVQELTADVGASAIAFIVAAIFSWGGYYQLAKWFYQKGVIRWRVFSRR